MRRRKDRPVQTYVTDSREQKVYTFSDVIRKDELSYGGELRYALDCGDYGIELNATLLPCRVERKQIADFFNCCGHERDRFLRELEKLARYKSYLLIEATPEQVRAGIERSQVSGEAAFASALCFSVRYNVSTIFTSNWKTGNSITHRLLDEYAVHYGKS
jgi:hypothetical protein